MDKRSDAFWGGVIVAAALFVSFFVMLGTPERVRAEQDTETIVTAASKILYENEGSYTSVNPDDNGAVSVGKLQWHGWRALALMKTIVVANQAQAKEMLGTELYTEITTYSTIHWKERILTSAEAAAIRKILATDESKKAQDELAHNDITDYINHGRNQGITNDAALVYYADLENQGGATASKRVATSAGEYIGNLAAVTLNEIHEAAICDSVMGNSAYLARRFRTYAYAAGLGWPYCNAKDSYIPYDYASAKADGAAWVQRALNACMDAKLEVTGVYDAATNGAVRGFQAAQGLSVDGYAGKNTVAALIKAVFQKQTVTPGENTEPNTGTESNAGANTGSDVNVEPGTDKNTETGNKKTTIKSAKTSYAVNDTQGHFTLQISSTHTQTPFAYASSDTSVIQVDSAGRVTVLTAGSAKITVSQAQAGEYAAGRLEIPVTVYSTDPSSYGAPTGSLYAGKNMSKSNVQWLQASLISLNGAKITVNGAWSDTMTSLVKDFQSKCGLEADGIAGEMTLGTIKSLLTVKTKKPTVSVKSSKAANRVYWDKCSGATRVYIYRKTTGGSYQRVKAVTDMSAKSWRDTKAKSGKTYYYAVRYVAVKKNIKVNGVLSRAAAGKRK